MQHTRWERAWGHRADDFDDVLVCASVGLPRELADKLSTFDTTQLVPYSPGFLAGWRAEEYAVDLAGGFGFAQGKMEHEQENRCGKDVPGDTQRNLRVDNTLQRHHLQARALAGVDRGLSLQQPDLPLPRERADRRGGRQGAVELDQDLRCSR